MNGSSSVISDSDVVIVVTIYCISPGLVQGVDWRWIGDLVLVKSCIFKLLLFCRQLFLFCDMDYCDIISIIFVCA